MKRTGLITTMILGLLSALNADAKVKLPQVISDCMVLQRNAPLNVWGWADPGENVTVRFDGQHFFTRADGDGKWSVQMPEHKDE